MYYVGIDIGSTAREDIAASSALLICSKVALLVKRKLSADWYFFTGGFCSSPYALGVLGAFLEIDIKTYEDARFIGAVGAAVSA
ncbi:MAG: hypothetical protein ACTTJ7_07795 [Treponema sp.]